MNEKKRDSIDNPKSEIKEVIKNSGSSRQPKKKWKEELFSKQNERNFVWGREEEEKTSTAK